MNELVARARAALGARGASARAWWVPGRIEFLGKHTDYAGGPSLLCATERGVAVVAVARGDTRVTVCDACTRERVEGELSGDAVVRHEHWSNYPFTVCRRVARNFSGVHHGIDLAFASNLPPASGLSSSSALIVATFLALADANDLDARAEYRESIQSQEDLAGYLGAIENGSDFRGLAGGRGVGTQGGSEDHTAILCAREDALVQYTFAPIRFERAIPLPDDCAFVVAGSGVVAEKTGSAMARYNEASARAAAALELWRRASGSTAPTLAAALAEPLNVGGELERLLTPDLALKKRVTHFAIESAIVRAAGDALLRGDLEQLGTLVDISQYNATMLLGNQVPETIALARSARELGAVAASAFGAGFGGSVYALVRENEAAEFRRRWEDWYAREFPSRADGATFFVTRAGGAATVI